MSSPERVRKSDLRVRLLAAALRGGDPSEALSEVTEGPSVTTPEGIDEAMDRVVRQNLTSLNEQAKKLKQEHGQEWTEFAAVLFLRTNHILHCPFSSEHP